MSRAGKKGLPPASYAGSSDPYEAVRATASTDNLELTITFD